MLFGFYEPSCVTKIWIQKGNRKVNGTRNKSIWTRKNVANGIGRNVGGVYFKTMIVSAKLSNQWRMIVRANFKGLEVASPNLMPAKLTHRLVCGMIMDMCCFLQHHIMLCLLFYVYVVGFML